MRMSINAFERITTTVALVIFLIFSCHKAEAAIARESAIAHYFLDGLMGIEVGAAAHGPFGLNTINVDYTDDPNTSFKQYEVKACGMYAKVDIVAPGDDLPFNDNSVDFVLSSHVIEHFYNPVKAIKEWWRVVRPGGYIFMIVPHKERTFDKDRPRTTLAEINDRYQNPNPELENPEIHHSVWITEDFLEMCSYYGWPVVAYQDVDDRVGNGFTIVIQKP